jgi:hypothetical protein
MSDNKASSRRALEAFAGGNLELLDEIVDASYVGHDVASPEPIRGVDGVRSCRTPREPRRHGPAVDGPAGWSYTERLR